VHEAQVVKRFHGSADLEGQAPGCLQVEAPLRLDLAEAASLHQLHDEKQLAVLDLFEPQHADQDPMHHRCGIASRAMRWIISTPAGVVAAAPGRSRIATPWLVASSSARYTVPKEPAPSSLMMR
jgi:hypothetical protein